MLHILKFKMILFLTISNKTRQYLYEILLKMRGCHKINAFFSGVQVHCWESENASISCKLNDHEADGIIAF
jgi:hypothetical protein